jgi:hypothetical protein
VYIEKYDADPSRLRLMPAVALEELVKIALQMSKIPELTGMQSPTVIT